MAGFCVKKPFTVFVVVVIVFALGITSFRSMKPELLPNIELPYVIAVTTYPGATSEQVESEVTKPLEQTFSSLSGLKNISSQSQANYCMVMMEFVDGTNLDGISLDILQGIDQISGAWDDLVGTPIIIKMNPNMLPVMIAAVERKGADTTELSRLMEEELLNKLEGIDGVASVSLTGLRREQVNVVLREDKIAVVNERMASAIEKEIDKKERELRDTKKDLEAKLNDIKASNTELESGVNKLATGMGEGWAGLPETISGELTKQIDKMKEQLTALNEAFDAIVAGIMPYIESLIQYEVAAWEADPANAGYTPEDLAAQTETITQFYLEMSWPVDPNIPSYADMKTGMVALEAGIATMEAQLSEIVSMATQQAEGALVTTSIETQFKMSSGAAALVAAQGQLAAGISQIETGLEQFEDALEDALKAADMSNVITMSMISALLKAQNFEMPAGTVQQDFTEYLVRVGDKLSSIEELQEMALMDTGNDDVGIIKLSDVADVFMSDNLADVYARLNGNDGLLVQFSKQSEYSTTEVTDAIMDRFDELSKQYPGLGFVPMMNQGDYIYMVINSILSDLLWGAVFALIILLLFLRDIRPTFITLCAIPISLVFALTAMYFAGVTINIISLSGLAIAVGRLVDDSVVVIENIFRLRAKGYSPVKAAVSGTMQVAGAITASTLTTICVFLPLVFVEGMTKQIFKDFGLTFAFALLASLAVAMTLVPTLASNMLGKMEPKEHRGLDRVIKVYDKALVWSLGHKPVILIVTVVLLIGSVWSVMTKGFEYMPSSVSSQLSVGITMPKETTPEERRERIDEAEARLLKMEGVSSVGLMSGGDGGSGGIMMLMGGGGSSAGGFLRNVTSYVILEDGVDSEKLMHDIENELSDIDMEVNVGSGDGLDASMLGGSGITINIFSDDPDVMMQTSKRITDEISNISGILEIDDGMEDVTPEIHFSVDRTKAAEFGLTTAQVFQQVNAALTKESNATQVVWKGDSFNVVIANEHALDEALSPDYIKNLSFTVTKRDGTVEKVKLAEITNISEGEALPSVLRDNQRRYLPVSISIAEDHNVTLVTQDVEAAIARLNLPDGVTYDVTGENATILDAFEQLGLMLILGLLLVYLIMVAQFQSLKSPFIIMFTIPLAFTGGFLALYLTGQVLSVVSLIGFAMLVGVIVANAIVLVDYINRLRLDGADRVTAIREGAATRMRPILMTALATIGALLMMALGVGEGSTLMQPLAIVCIGGLAYGTLMTLFVIPIIYDAFSKKELRVISSDDLIVDRDA